MTPAELQQVVDLLNELYNNMRKEGYYEAAELIEVARDNTIKRYYDKRKKR